MRLGFISWRRWGEGGAEVTGLGNEALRDRGMTTSEGVQAIRTLGLRYWGDGDEGRDFRQGEEP